MIFYEPHRRDRSLLPHDPFKAIIAPRPVGWISTTGPDGEVNLAPYSFFNAVCEAPIMLAFSSQGPKHSATFAGAAQEFVWNLATWDLREQMNDSSAPLPHGAERVRARGPGDGRVADRAAPAGGREPVLDGVQGPPDARAARPRRARGRPVPRHRPGRRRAPRSRYVVDGQVDTAALRPVARCGYLGEYAVVESLFHMGRPRGAEPPGF